MLELSPMFLLAAFVLGTQADEPRKLELRTEPRAPVCGVPFHLIVRTNEEFTGVVAIDGIRGIKTVRVERGRKILRNAVADRETLKARAGGMRTEIRPRFLSAWICLMPPILVILLAFATRQVVPSLLAGVLAGSAILWGSDAEGLVLSVPRALDLVVMEIAEPMHARLLVMVLLMGGFVGLLVFSGALRGLADRLAESLRTRRSGMLGTWGLCLVLFFDDYANSLIAGNTMRPIADRLRISREKLSYLVDSTAGPMTAIGLVSTWMLFEEKLLLSSGLATGADLAAVVAHLAPYSFYTVLAIVLVFLIAFSQRDFGPMRRAEIRAIETGQVLHHRARPMIDREISEIPHIENLRDRWTGAAVPILTLIVTSVAGLMISGLRNPLRPADQAGFMALLEYGRPFQSFIAGTIAATAVAAAVGLARRHLGALQAVEAWLRGMRGVLVAAVILVLAWSMSEICTNLSVGAILISNAALHKVGPWLPTIVFLACAAASLATGSAWGALVLMLSVVAPALSADVPDGVRYGTVAAVLSGALFGDHVSPISDTTVISSLGTGADHIDHVKTQAPYAVLAALVAIVLGFIPAGFGWSPYLCLALGAAGLAVVVFTVGKRLPPIAREEE